MKNLASFSKEDSRILAGKKACTSSTCSSWGTGSAKESFDHRIGELKALPLRVTSRVPDEEMIWNNFSTGCPNKTSKSWTSKMWKSRAISAFSYQTGMLCKILIPSMVEHSPIHKDLEVGSKGLLLRWISA